MDVTDTTPPESGSAAPRHLPAGADAGQVDPEARAELERRRLMADIERRFGTHEMDGDQRGRAELLTDLFRELAFASAEHMQQGRELSIVLTKLEEAKFMAVAGIAREGK